VKFPALAAAVCLSAICAAACAGPAAANGDKQTMSDAKSAFAQALGASFQSISEFVAVPIAAAPADALWLGSSMVGGEPQSWALAACKGRPCPGAKPVSLPTASSLAVLALLDLQGAPFKIDLRQPPANPARAQPMPQKAKKPAALVRARHKLDSGEERDTLVIVPADKSGEILWQQTASSSLPNGGGFQSLELSFAKPAKGPWLDVGLLQHTVPAKGEQPFAPGPPLKLEFAYRQGAYQRVK